ncbi:hypothetical protein KIPB_011256 [Kipferlia bialata]|uniref:Uncharacterized protein n=1 Tax=Kipferlia bialata TaxID=797122 RepID=A0A9K3GM60_9EUKA|nr:hypothetical protein KIPB_011256 [Kipferlia bialata]|eukprot:g11256.t1
MDDHQLPEPVTRDELMKELRVLEEKQAALSLRFDVSFAAASASSTRAQEAHVLSSPIAAGPRTLPTASSTLYPLPADQDTFDLDAAIGGVSSSQINRNTFETPKMTQGPRHPKAVSPQNIASSMFVAPSKDEMLAAMEDTQAKEERERERERMEEEELREAVLLRRRNPERASTPADLREDILELERCEAELARKRQGLSSILTQFEDDWHKTEQDQLAHSAEFTVSSITEYNSIRATRLADSIDSHVHQQRSRDDIVQVIANSSALRTVHNDRDLDEFDRSDLERERETEAERHRTQARLGDRRFTSSLSELLSGDTEREMEREAERRREREAEFQLTVGLPELDILPEDEEPEPEPACDADALPALIHQLEARERVLQQRMDSQDEAASDCHASEVGRVCVCGTVYEYMLSASCLPSYPTLCLTPRCVTMRGRERVAC